MLKIGCHIFMAMVAIVSLANLIITSRSPQNRGPVCCDTSCNATIGRHCKHFCRTGEFHCPNRPHCACRFDFCQEPDGRCISRADCRVKGCIESDENPYDPELPMDEPIEPDDGEFEDKDDDKMNEQACREKCSSGELSCMDCVCLPGFCRMPDCKCVSRTDCRISANGCVQKPEWSSAETDTDCYDDDDDYYYYYY